MRPQRNATEAGTQPSAIPFVAAIALLTLVTFWPALSAEFLNWDDPQNITQNPAFRGLSWPNLKWMFSTFLMGPYQPLSWLSLGMDYTLWGMNPERFHLTNVLLHALTAVLFFFVARRLLLLAATAGQGATATVTRNFAAVSAAAFFAIHPLRCESVAWITERRDVLSGVFYVGCVLLYLRYVSQTEPRHRRRAYLACLAVFVAALLSKASGMTLPFALLLLDAWPLRRFSRRPAAEGASSTEPSATWSGLVVEKIPFLAASAVAAGLAWWGQSSVAGTAMTLAQHPLSNRVVQAGYAMAYYPAVTLAPIRLTPIHDLPLPFNPLAPALILPAVAACLVTVALLVLRRRWPAAAVAWLVFVVMLAPVSGLAQTGPQLVADRYSYLACMPLALLAGGCVARLMAAAGRRRMIATLVLGIVLFLAVDTFQYTRIWRTSESLWRHAYQIDPHSWNACDNLASIAMNQARAAATAVDRVAGYDRAAEFLRSVPDAEKRDEVLYNLACLDLWRADEQPDREAALIQSAIDHFSRARACSRGMPPIPEWGLNYGVALLRAGRHADAVTEYERYIAQRPESAEGYFNLGNVLVMIGRHRDALVVLETSLLFNPTDERAWWALGVARSGVGDRPGAIEAYWQVLQVIESRVGDEAVNDVTYRRAAGQLQALGTQP